MAENTLSVLKIAPGQHPQQVEIDNDLKADPFRLLGIHLWRDYYRHRTCPRGYRLSGKNEICKVFQSPGTDVHVQGGCGYQDL